MTKPLAEIVRGRDLVNELLAHAEWGEKFPRHLTQQTASLLREAAAALEAREWVSVEDRLPDAEITVLTATDDGEVYACYEDGGSAEDGGIWYHEGGTKLRNSHVTHWQPLPQPPTGGDK